MDGTVRLRLAVNPVRSGNPAACLGGIKERLAELGQAAGEDIVVFPKLALCPPSAGSLMGAGLAGKADEALRELLEHSAGLDCCVIVGLPIEEYGLVRPVMAVLHRGELVAFVPHELEPDGRAPSLFQCGALRFAILSCELGRLASRALEAAAKGADLLIIPAYEPVRAGFIDEVRESARAASREAGCAVAVVNGGAGDTSSPWLYQAFAAIYEGGEELALGEGGRGGFSIAADLDADVIHAVKTRKTAGPPSAYMFPASEKAGLLRPVRQSPWLPAAHAEAYLAELFRMQAASLASRMENAGLERLVLGVSGGLDSTGALFAAAAACDLLQLPRTNILGVTMPGFGTSDRTYRNAGELLAALGVTAREIPIRAAVERHFLDIGHGGGKDAAYENAQARERAQILLDLANMERALVVGTGDLSEAALGFTTFAGDHIANYDVNVCLTKTLLRELVRHVADSGVLKGADIAGVAADILATPVSPELLPPGEGGDIEQKTEEILGPYLLHDFFLYHFLAYRLPPKKLLAYAAEAFAGELAPGFIREKLRLFYKKFAAGQFKRACAPDAASITKLNLLGVNYYLPSDFDAEVFLSELE